MFVFDEADKVEEIDFLYTLLEDIYRKTIILITNDKEWLSDLDDRVKSRLAPEIIEFKPYNPEETKEILKQRISYAFVPNVWEKGALEAASNKTYELQDMRIGLHIIKEAGMIAENESSRNIKLSHVGKAISKIDEFSIKSKLELSKEEQEVLDIIKENSGSKIGDLFNEYTKRGGSQAYKTFQRRIEKLQKDRFISVKKTEGGKEGNTSIVSIEKTRKLTEF